MLGQNKNVFEDDVHTINGDNSVFQDGVLVLRIIYFKVYIKMNLYSSILPSYNFYLLV